MLDAMNRWSSTTILSASLVTLVAIVAIQQWRWIDEIERYDHFSRNEHLRQATNVFKTVFDREVSILARWMTAPSAPLADAARDLGDRLDGWRASTRWPGLVASVYLVEPASGRGEPKLARLDTAAGELVAVAWPEALQPLLPPFADLGFLRASQLPADVLVVASIPAIVGFPADRQGPSTLVVLDETYLTGSMIPEMVELAFPEESYGPVEVAITEAATGRVVYSTSGVAHASSFGRVDVFSGLVRDGVEIAELEEFSALLESGASRGSGEPRPSALVPWSLPEPTAEGEKWLGRLWTWLWSTGHWRILVRSETGPVEEVVAAEKNRKVAAAFGLLALLGASVTVLTVANRRAQRAARRELEQLALISHELRTPLTVLASAGDNLADGLFRSQERTTEYGRVIQRETRRLRELVENVLHLAYRRRKEPQRELRPIDVVHLIEESLEVAEPGLKEAGFTVERSLPSRRLEILGDPSALRSTLLNLISNAVKYGREARWLRLAAEETGTEVRIVVEDRGPGLDPRELERLSEPYTRGDREAVDTEGSGLGLAVVKSVVAAHAGRISVGNPEAGGTSLALHFPAVRSE